MEAGDAPGTFFIGDMKDSTYFVIRRRYDGQVLVAKKATLTQFVGH